MTLPAGSSDDGSSRGAKKDTGAKSKKSTRPSQQGKGRRRTISFEEIRKSGYWDRARERAKRLMEDEEQLERLVEEADRKPKGRKRGPLNDVLHELRALLRLVRAYAKGEYRDVSAESMITIVGAIIYFVSPIDLMPDPLPVVGHVDDAAVIAWTVRRVRGEIDDFLEWEASGEG